MGRPSKFRKVMFWGKTQLAFARFAIGALLVVMLLAPALAPIPVVTGSAPTFIDNSRGNLTQGTQENTEIWYPGGVRLETDNSGVWGSIVQTLPGDNSGFICETDDNFYIGKTNSFNKFLKTGGLGTVLSAPSENFQVGSDAAWDGGDYIYALLGGTYASPRKLFRRYQISTNTWENLENTPYNQGPGDSIVWVSTEENLYMLLGGGSQTAGFFVRFNPADNTFASLAMPTNVGVDEGADLIWTQDNYLYATFGAYKGANLSKDFKRFRIPDNTWAALADTPDPQEDGGALTWPGGDYIYATCGKDEVGGTLSDNFFRYSISDNSWVQITDLPVTIGNFAGDVLASVDNEVYFWNNGNSDGITIPSLYRFDFRYLLSGRFTSRAFDTGSTATWGKISWQVTTPTLTLGENDNVGAEPSPLVDNSSQTGTASGSYTNTQVQDGTYENITEASGLSRILSQSDWSGGATSPTLQVGSWDGAYDNYYQGENENKAVAGIITLALTGGQENYGNRSVITSASGVKKMDTWDNRNAVRFTAKNSGTANKIAVALQEWGTSPAYLYSIFADNENNPGFPGTRLIDPVSQTVTSTGWVLVDIPNVSITAGNVYFIIVTASPSGAPNSSNCVALGGSLPHHKLVPYDQSTDNNVNLLTTNDNGATWVVENYMPMYALNFISGVMEGNPYMLAQSSPNNVITADNWRGEQFVPTENRWVKAVSFYVQKVGSPAENLFYTLYDVTNGTQLENGVVERPSGVGTSHSWITVDLSRPRRLQENNTYRIYLKTIGNPDSANYYQVNAPYTNSDLSAFNALTYDGTNSVWTYTTNYGGTWTTTNNTDAAFVLILDNFKPAGYIDSSIFDAGYVVNWNTANWDASIPDNTSVRVKLRTGSDNNPYDGGGWSDWYVHENNSENTSMPNNRYAQYRVELYSDNLKDTPQFQSIQFRHLENFSLRWEHRITNVDNSCENYWVRIYGKTSGDNENVGVYIWDNSTGSWEFIDNLTTAERLIEKAIPRENISRYLHGGVSGGTGQGFTEIKDNLSIKYQSADNTDADNTTIHIDLCILVGENYYSSSLSVYARASSDNSTWTNWQGPYSTSTGSTITLGDNRYIRYKAEISSENERMTPVLSNVNITYITLPVSSSPENNYNTNDNTPTFQWENYSIADNYELWVDNDNDFGSPEIKENTTENSRTITTQLSDGVYYWKVRAYGGDVVSSFSGVRYFRVDTIAQAPTLVSPENDNQYNDPTPMLSWNTVSDNNEPVKYRVWIDNDSDFSSPENISSWDFNNNYTSPELADGVYYWRVKTMDSLGNESEASTTRKFLVDTTPPNTVLTPYSPDPTNDYILTYVGTATDTQTKIVAIQYSVNGGSWTDASPVTPGLSVSFSFATSSLANDIYTIEARARDNAGNWDTSPALDIITVWRSTPGSPPQSPPLFKVTVNPTGGSVEQGGTRDDVMVMVIASEGYDKTITLSAYPLSGVSTDFSPSSGSQYFTSTMTLSVGSAPTGNHTVFIYGDGEDGASYGTIYSLTITPAQRNVEIIEAGENHTFDFTANELPVSEVTITAGQELINVGVSIEVLPSRPANVPQPAMLVYCYLQITTTADMGDIQWIVVEFKVPKSWIEQNNLNEQMIKMLRFDGGWQELPTQYIGGDESYSYFEVTTSGFSVFAVTGEKVASPSLFWLLPLAVISMIITGTGSLAAYIWTRPSKYFRLLKRLEREVKRKGTRRVGEQLSSMVAAATRERADKVVAPEVQIHRSDISLIKQLQRIVIKRLKKKQSKRCSKK